MQLPGIVSALTALAVSIGAPRAQSVLGIVRDAEGETVAGAHLTFFGAQDQSLPWNSAVEPAVHVGRSRADGRFRFGVSASAGVLWIEHPERGAALLPRAHPGVPIAAQLENPATLKIAPDESVQWHLRAKISDTESVPVRSVAGTEVRVPAGSYIVYVECFMIREVTVAAGETRTLQRPRVGEQRAIDGGGMALPDWPNAGKLPYTKHTDRSILPLSDHAVRISQRLQTEVGTLRIVHTYDGRNTPRVDGAQRNWRPLVVRDAATSRPLSNVDVYSVEQSGARMHVRSAARTDENGTAPVATSVEGDTTFLVLHREGAAPLAFPQPVESPLDVSFTPAADLLIRVQVEDPQLAPPAIIRIDQAPWQFMPRFVTTNPRGEAHIRDLLPGRTTIVVQHPNYRTAERELVAGTDRRIVVELDPGRVIHGKVVRGATPLAGTILELRDAQGRTAAGTRIVAAGPDGSFRIPGLDDGEYTLFAQFQQDGQTWSTRLSGVSADQSPLRIALEAEDPPPPHRRDQ